MSSLLVPQEFVDWALEELQRTNNIELTSRSTIEDNLQDKVKKISAELDNLLKMYISVENKDKTLLSTEDYMKKKDELTQEKQKTEELTGGYSKKQQDWMKTAEEAFDFVVHARKRFEKGTKEVKREIASAFGLNLTLDNRLLRYDLKNQFATIKKAADRMKDPLNKIEPVRKIVVEGQTYHFDSANPLWGDRRGSNPRQLAPQASALPTELRPPIIVNGCGIWIRTKINGSKVHCPAVRRSRNTSRCHESKLASFDLENYFFKTLTLNKLLITNYHCL